MFSSCCVCSGYIALQTLWDFFLIQCTLCCRGSVIDTCTVFTVNKWKRSFKNSQEDKNFPLLCGLRPRSFFSIDKNPQVILLLSNSHNRDCHKLYSLLHQEIQTQFVFKGRMEQEGAHLYCTLIFLSFLTKDWRMQIMLLLSAASPSGTETNKQKIQSTKIRRCFWITSLQSIQCLCNHFVVQSLKWKYFCSCNKRLRHSRAAQPIPWPSLCRVSQSSFSGTLHYSLLHFCTCVPIRS